MSRNAPTARARSLRATQTHAEARRTAYLQAEGFRVVRFWNSYVLEFRADACDVILAACGGETPSPNLSPKGERRTPGQTSSHHLLSPSRGGEDG